jgi:hypothetical protein
MTRSQFTETPQPSTREPVRFPLAIALPLALRDDLSQLAMTRNCSMSALVEAAVQYYLDLPDAEPEDGAPLQLTIQLPFMLHRQLESLACRDGLSLPRVIYNVLTQYVSLADVFPQNSPRKPELLPPALPIVDSLFWGEKHGNGYVYFIHATTTAFVKIGYSHGVTHFTRLRELQTSNMYTLQVLAKIRTSNARRLEEAIHKRLEGYRVRGEWFALPPVIIDALRALPLPS